MGLVTMVVVVGIVLLKVALGLLAIPELAAHLERDTAAHTSGQQWAAAVWEPERTHKVSVPTQL